MGWMYRGSLSLREWLRPNARIRGGGSLSYPRRIGSAPYPATSAEGAMA